MIQHLSCDPAQYTPVCGEPPGGDLQQHGRGGRTESRHSLYRSFDSCFDSCFDRSSAGSTDHLVISTRGRFFYACCCCCRCCCSWHGNRRQCRGHRTGSAAFAEPLVAAHTSAAEVHTHQSSLPGGRGGAAPSTPVGMLSSPRNTTPLQCFASKRYHIPFVSHPLITTSPSWALRPTRYHPGYMR